MIRSYFLLLLGFAFLLFFVESGLAKINITDAELNFGRIEIEPGPDFQIEPGKDFVVKCTYYPGPLGCPPQTSIEIIPPPRKDTVPLAIHTVTKKFPPNVDIVSDPFFSSLSHAQQGSLGRYLIRLHDGLERRESITFKLPIQVPFYGYTRKSPYVMQLRVNLRSADMNILKSFDTPEWSGKIFPPAQMNFLAPSKAETGRNVKLLISFLPPTSANIGNVTVLAQKDVFFPLGNTVEILKDDWGSKNIICSFKKPGIYRLSAISDGGFEALSNPIMIEKSNQLSIYWGNLHTHSNYSWDQRNLALCNITVEEMIDMARYLFLLDFIAITDHGQHNFMGGNSTCTVTASKEIQVDMSEKDWEQYHDDILKSSNSEIITYVGYEHRDGRGDTNIIFLNGGEYFAENSHRMDLGQVWKRESPGKILSIPHFHPRPSAELFKTRSFHETLLEIYSTCWGAFEFRNNPQPASRPAPNKPARKPLKRDEQAEKNPGCFARDLLNMGRRLGFTASEDHGLPGSGGITATFANEKSREKIFDALLKRKTFVTSGPRMIVNFRIKTLTMGDEITVRRGDRFMESRLLKIEVHGTSPIDFVQVIRNGKVFHEEEVGKFDWIKEIPDKDSLENISIERGVGGEKTTYYPPVSG